MVIASPRLQIACPGIGYIYVINLPFFDDNQIKYLDVLPRLSTRYHALKSTKAVVQERQRAKIC